MNNPFQPKIAKIIEINEDTARKNYYGSWRKFNQLQNAPFIAIDNVFKDKYLNKLESGPLRLYLYFAFAAKNKHGHSWHSISTIADYFKAQTRTIDNWIKALVDEGLIYRQRAGKKSNTTYLIPFSHTFLVYRKRKNYRQDNQEMLDDCLENINGLKEIYGDVVKVYHFFQWSDGRQDKSTNQALFVLSKRRDIITVNMITLTKLDDLGISETDIGDIARFESPFEFAGEKIMGLAFPDNPVFNSIKTSQYLLESLVELADSETWQFEELEPVKYDKIEILFPEEDDATPTAENEEVDTTETTENEEE